VKPKLILFDCANTLLWTDWQPHHFAVRCANKSGITLPDNAAEMYLQLLQPKMPEFWALNRLRSIEAWRAFWVRQVEEWLEVLGIWGYNALELHLVAEKEIFEAPSDTFRLFDDVIPTLTKLREQGYLTAVLSNWDTSLHKCLAAHELTPFFDARFASLEEGVEKPDQRLYQIALDHFGVLACDCFHVGDDILDDFEGATKAGIPVALLNREVSTNALAFRIQTLSDLEEAFGWYD
jgi:HAD superfamily hydrolase (TIGR01549 family)